MGLPEIQAEDEEWLLLQGCDTAGKEGQVGLGHLLLWFGGFLHSSGFMNIESP